MNIREQDKRTASLIGEDALQKLKRARVAVLGIGGVGGYTVEALARAGVGALDLFDGDTVSLSNINRQIIALHSTVGRLKTEVMAERIAHINPECRVTLHNGFLTPEALSDIDLSSYDFIVDAIDTVSVKIALAKLCEDRGIPLISSMGTGNKLDPTAFKITDIYKTSVCPLARAMRSELRRLCVKHLTVLYSDEVPRHSGDVGAKADGARAPASISFVPSAGGLIIAGEVIRRLCEAKQ